MTPRVLCAVLVASRAASAHPADPFAGEYTVPEERDVGTTAGQIHFIASSVLGRASLGGQLTVELMTIAAIGIRSSVQVDVVHSAAVAARTGPALHLLPYRWFDVSLFVEGGVVHVDPPTGGGYFAPTLSPGIASELWLTSSWFVAVEAHLDWTAQPRASGTAGLGVGF